MIPQKLQTYSLIISDNATHTLVFTKIYKVHLKQLKRKGRFCFSPTHPPTQISCSLRVAFLFFRIMQATCNDRRGRIIKQSCIPSMPWEPELSSNYEFTGAIKIVLYKIQTVKAEHSSLLNLEVFQASSSIMFPKRSTFLIISVSSYIQKQYPGF